MRHAVLLLLLVTTGTGVLAPPVSFAGLREIPAGSTIVSVGQESAAVFDEFTAQSGVDPAATMWYSDIFSSVRDQGAGLARIAADANRRPNTALNLAISFGAISTPTYSRAPRIGRGRFDRQIDVLAAWLKQLDRAVFLRIGYEFDLFQGQYGPPAVYIAAYRRVVDRLRSAGVDNVAYVWHSAGMVTPFDGRIPIKRFYPGPAYVDYFGISYWGNFCCVGHDTRGSRASYERRTRTFLDQAKALGLPIQFSEATPAYVGANRGAASVEWLDRYFALVDEYDIRSLNLITRNWPAESKFFGAWFWNGFWPDARVTRYADTKKRFLDEIAKPRYIAGSPQLNAWLRGTAAHPGAAADAP